VALRSQEPALAGGFRTNGAVFYNHRVTADPSYPGDGSSMWSFSSSTARCRPGFTLIEMITVLTIMLVLTFLAIAFVPRVQERQKAGRGAEQLHNYLHMLKQRALRDQVVTGVRLSPSQENPQLVMDLQAIQQPDDFYGGLPSKVRYVSVINLP